MIIPVCYYSPRAKVTATSLLISKLERLDTGSYTVKASNIHGQDLINFTLTVLSPPSPPLGPVKVSEVTQNGCKIAWKAPQDDGGSPLSEYIVETMEPKSGKTEECGKSLAGMTTTTNTFLVTLFSQTRRLTNTN